MKDPISCLSGISMKSLVFVVLCCCADLTKKSQCVPVMAVYSYAVSAYSINIVCVLRKHCRRTT